MPIERRARPTRRVRLGLLWIALLAAQPPALLAAEIPDAADACLEGQTEATPSGEFTTLGDGSVVRHERTTLEWQRCAVGQSWDGERGLCNGRPRTYNWDQASKLAARAQDGWRLPKARELLSIVESCHQAPAINPQVFPNTPGVLFWTGSLDTGGIDRIWCVSFFGGSYYRAGKTQNARVRLVRGTMQENPNP